jgi:hypothetical protein
VLGVRGMGQPQWHAAYDPTFVETISCVLGEIPKVRKWVKPAMWYKAICSVACLEYFRER